MLRYCKVAVISLCCAFGIFDSVKAGPGTAAIKMFDIPATAARESLQVFSKESGLKILASAGDISGVRTRRIQGQMTSEAALRQLLRGSGLKAVVGDDATILITHPVKKSLHPNSGHFTASRPFQDALETIIVTAQKIPETQFSTPVSVSVADYSDLRSHEVYQTADLGNLMSRLSVMKGGNPQNSGFLIRGIGSVLYGVGDEADVAVVMDGVVLARGAMGFQNFMDVDRIEVVSGPQNTLFGKNSIAGVISITTHQPTARTQYAVHVSEAEAGELHASATVSGKINGQLFGRFTISSHSVPGNISNLTSHTTENERYSWGAAGKLLWLPTDYLSFTLSANYRNTHSNCCVRTVVQSEDAVLTDLLQPVKVKADNQKSVDNTVSYYKSRMQIYALTGKLRHKDYDITSISAVQNFHYVNNKSLDLMDTSTPIYSGGAGGYDFAAFDLNGGSIDILQASQELRLSSARHAQNGLKYVVGFYGTYLDILRQFRRRRAYCASGTLGEVCDNDNLTWQSARSRAHLQTSTVALWGQIEYPLTTYLSAIGGMRAQEEISAIHKHRVSPIATYAGDDVYPGLSNGLGSRHSSDFALTGKAGLQYFLNRRINLYFTYSRGYKGIGFSTEIDSDFSKPAEIHPETANAAEMGMKYHSSDRHYFIYADVFGAKYYNLQVNAPLNNSETGSITTIQSNAGLAKTYGVEFSFRESPVRGLWLTENFAYTHAVFNMKSVGCPVTYQATAQLYTDAVPDNVCYLTGSGDGSQVLENIHNGTMPYTPQFRLNLGLAYSHALSQTMSGMFTISSMSTSSVLSSLNQDPLLHVSGYTIVNASLGLSMPEYGLRTTVFVKNLFDTLYYDNIAHVLMRESPENYKNLAATIPHDAHRYFGLRVSIQSVAAN